jgi:hypothetical protein
VFIIVLPVEYSNIEPLEMVYNLFSFKIYTSPDVNPEFLTSSSVL